MDITRYIVRETSYDVFVNLRSFSNIFDAIIIVPRFIVNMSWTVRQGRAKEPRGIYRCTLLITEDSSHK